MVCSPCGSNPHALSFFVDIGYGSKVGQWPWHSCLPVSVLHHWNAEPFRCEASTFQCEVNTFQCNAHSQADMSVMVIDQLWNHDACLWRIRQRAGGLGPWGLHTLWGWTSGFTANETCSHLYHLWTFVNPSASVTKLLSRQGLLIIQFHYIY